MKNLFEFFNKCGSIEELAHYLHNEGVSEYDLKQAATILGHPIMFKTLLSCLEDCELNERKL